MGNCQAVDTATLVIQHPSGQVDKLYWSVTAGDVMKANPGHFVALLITTTIYQTTPQNTTDNGDVSSSSSLRVTKVKLLRPTETLALGHAYRLITNQEVMDGLVAKKQAKLKQNGIELADKGDALKDVEKAAQRYQLHKNQEATRQERHRSRTTRAASGGGTTRSKAWQPSLNSIREVGT